MAKTKESKSREVIVRVYALDRKYRSAPYPAVAAEDTRNDTFVTGQHYEPGKDHYLTVDEMTGKKDLTQAQKKIFPYVINPLNTVMIMHGAAFNLTTGNGGEYLYPKDVAILNFIRLQEIVAPSKSEYRKGKHYFYIEDRQKDSTAFVTKTDKEFDAMSLIYKNSGMKNMREFCLLLQYYHKGFKVDLANWTDTMVKEALLKVAKENPDSILKCGLPSAQNDLYVLLLSEHKIIQQKSDGFYDGSSFLGVSPGAVYSAINTKENEALASRCKAALANFEEMEESE